MNVSEALGRIDWNFPRAGTDAGSVHSVHWFPGNFIPQIPMAFIEALSKPGDLVFDPFGGSGTTAIEAARLGRRAILSDRISACTLIGRAKLEIQAVGLNRNIKSEILASLTWRHQCLSESFGSNGEGSDARLSRWFAPLTLSQLRYLWKLIESQSNHAARHVLTLLFSDVLFACASPGKALTSTGKRRRHHWGWVADNVYPKKFVEHDAVDLFEARLASVPECTLIGHSGEILVVQQDARCLALAPRSVDLVVTSPPYIGVIDYTRANRLLYVWMQWPLLRERNEEIGARFKRRRRGAVDEYIEEMRLCWNEIFRVLRTGGYCAIIIGESRRFPGAVDRTLDDLSKLMSQVWGPVKRTSTRRRVSDRAANQAIEYLHVFRKP
jgi:DNA methylase